MQVLLHHFFLKNEACLAEGHLLYILQKASVMTVSIGMLVERCFSIE